MFTISMVLLNGTYPLKYPAITSCLYHASNDNLKNFEGTFPTEPRTDTFLKYIYYFKSAENE